MRRLIILMMAATLMVGVFAACSNGTQQSAKQNTTAPVSTGSASQPAATSPSPQKEEVPQNIIFGEGDTIDAWVPNAGEINLSGGVSQALRTIQDKDALLFVRLSFHSDSHQDFHDNFTFEGKTREEWSVSLESLSREYDDGYWEYYVVEDAKINWEEVETTEQKEKLLNAIRAAWDEIWYETHDIHPLAENLRFYVAFETAERARSKALTLAEHERLTSHGLIVSIITYTRQDDVGNVFEYHYLVGYLTVAQIENFPCGDYGYVISWADKDDVIDE